MTILSDKTVFYPAGDFKAILKKSYTSITRQLKKEAKKGVEKEEDELMFLIEDIEVLLNLDGNFLQCNCWGQNDENILSFTSEEELITYLSLIHI